MRIGLVRLVGSSKFWLTVGGCVAAAMTGQWHMIPILVMANVAGITIEDAAEKLGIKLREK